MQVKKFVDAVKQSKPLIKKIENEKRKNTELLIPLVNQMNSEQIEKAFDKSLFKDIAAQFDKCNTQTELNLLDTIEVIAKCAAEHESQKYRQNFANIFVKSGLLACILNGINEIALIVVSYPNLLPILIALTFTTKNLDQIADTNKSMIKHKVLVEMKFVRSLALAECLGGGIEDNNSIIKSAKISFDSIILPHIKILNKQQQYSSLRSSIEEEIEYEGGFEEFDSLDSDKRKRIKFRPFSNFNHFINNPFM
ncbi:MAG: hypothetical protein EZS28_019851 [Streblomastix strix]|uniref:Uncharacterized protein n=1 Tax=Streblomastix strix TaxID=222440 RepID=A0A5J4VPY3_9EUKA|nr:MAG: hypothetical protein EZS28_019851 [Streblomastix strix]